MQFKKNHLFIFTVLLMFPQFVETVYSPILPSLALTFSVSVESASQTLSIYFVSFALGIAFWGYFADVKGRKSSLILGLSVYAIGSTLAIFVDEFNFLLLARFISAFGAAAASIVVQTMLRDSYQGVELKKAFAVIGMAMALSPIVGLLAGGLINEISGYIGVFILLIILAVLLVLLAHKMLNETRLTMNDDVSFIQLALLMSRDVEIWRNAVLIALFNLMLFSYYSLAPFIFADLGLSSSQFGYSGVVMALGALLGGGVNKVFVKYSVTNEHILVWAILFAMLAGIGVYFTQTSMFFLLPMLVVNMSYGIAIPTILSVVLDKYSKNRGKAGAILGLIYYSLLAMGLYFAAIIHDLAYVLCIAAFMSGCILKLKLSAQQ